MNEPRERKKICSWRKGVIKMRKAEEGKDGKVKNKLLIGARAVWSVFKVKCESIHYLPRSHMEGGAVSLQSKRDDTYTCTLFSLNAAHVLALS
ncbi:hypothetical protein PO909_019598 [Leuciscus waleckii]